MVLVRGAANIALVLPAPVTARYLRSDLIDGAAAFMDIGLLVAGQLWRLQRRKAYGIRDGRVMLDRRDRNPVTGARFPVPAIINPRFAAFTLPALSLTDARNQHRDLLRRLGVAGDALWIAELGDSLAERNRRVIWGRSMHRGRKQAPAGIAFRWHPGRSGWWGECESGTPIGGAA